MARSLVARKINSTTSGERESKREEKKSREKKERARERERKGKKERGRETRAHLQREKSNFDRAFLARIVVDRPDRRLPRDPDPTRPVQLVVECMPEVQRIRAEDSMRLEEKVI